MSRKKIYLIELVCLLLVIAVIKKRFPDFELADFFSPQKKEVVEKVSEVRETVEKGLEYEAQGELDRAFLAYKNALTLLETSEEDQEWAHAIIARAYSRIGQMDLARTLLKSAGDTPLALETEAELEIYLKNYVRATEIYESLVLNDSNPSYLIRLGSLYQKLQDSKAERAFQLAEAVLQKNQQDHLNWARLYLRKKQYQLAEKRARQLETPEGRALLAEALLHLEHHEEAYEVISSLLETGVKRAEFFYLAGLLAEKLGKEREKQIDFAKVNALIKNFESF